MTSKISVEDHSHLSSKLGMNSTLVLLLLAIVVGTSGQLIGKCGDARSRTFDACAQTPMVMGRNNSIFPRDIKEAEGYCKDSKKSIVCMRKFAKECLSALPKQGASLLAYGINKNVKRVCKTEESREYLGEHIKCMNKDIPKLNKIFDKLVSDYHHVAVMDSKDMLNGVCCRWFNFEEEVLKAAKDICSDEDATYVKSFVHNFSNDVVELLCSGIAPDSNTCKNLVLPKEKLEITEKPVSFIPGLLEVLVRL